MVKYEEKSVNFIFVYQCFFDTMLYTFDICKYASLKNRILSQTL